MWNFIDCEGMCQACLCLVPGLLLACLELALATAVLCSLTVRENPKPAIKFKALHGVRVGIEQLGYSRDLEKNANHKDREVRHHFSCATNAVAYRLRPTLVELDLPARLLVYAIIGASYKSIPFDTSRFLLCYSNVFKVVSTEDGRLYTPPSPKPSA